MRCAPACTHPGLPHIVPLTCKICVDHNNRLPDVTVGCMGGDDDQWLTVRNDRCAELLSLIQPQRDLEPRTDKGKRTAAVKGFIEHTARATGGMPLGRMPNWLRPIVRYLQPRIGPRGLEFTLARVEMKTVETILHLRRAHPAQAEKHGAETCLAVGEAGWVGAGQG